MKDYGAGPGSAAWAHVESRGYVLRPGKRGQVWIDAFPREPDRGWRPLSVPASQIAFLARSLGYPEPAATTRRASRAQPLGG